MRMAVARVVVLVKAAPVLTNDLDENMCVAGARVDTESPEWIRLHPVPFRDLASEARFKKYQELGVDVRRPKTDRRPESWEPRSATIEPGGWMGTDHGWADRRDLVSKLFEANMCDLVEANRRGSGPTTRSLAVVRPRETPALVFKQRDPTQLADWRRRADGAKNRMSLFDQPAVSKSDWEPVPWKFMYRYRCCASRCNGHLQSIIDWEASALWRRVRHRSDWQNQMRSRFEEEMWDGKAAALFVGNQEQRPVSFLVLGVFWPPDVSYQPGLPLS